MVESGSIAAVESVIVVVGPVVAVAVFVVVAAGIADCLHSFGTPSEPADLPIGSQSLTEVDRTQKHLRATIHKLSKYIFS